MDDLARLIEGYPRQHYSIVQTGIRGAGRVWREGDLAISVAARSSMRSRRGELWLNLREVGQVDSRYRELVDRMFEQVAARARGFEVPEFHQAGILISSPGSLCETRAWPTAVTRRELNYRIRRTTPGWPGAHSSASRSHLAVSAAAS
jgi:hypothetical protein